MSEILTHDDLALAFEGEFMRPQIVWDYYFEVETTAGTFIVPGYITTRSASVAAHYFADYVEGDILDGDAVIEPKDGWLARLSAPGYLDCTDWTAHKTEQEAAQYLVDTYAN